MSIEHVSTISGIGIGRSCVIIGGGITLDSFPRGRIPGYYYIGCNLHRFEDVDMVIYYDPGIRDALDDMDTTGKLVLTMRQNEGCDRTGSKTTHYYRFADIRYGDTGWHAFQFADLVFGFSEIYLAGFDYFTADGKYHHSEGETGNCAMFERHSIARVLPLFSEYKPRAKVYKCSPDSRVPFPFQLPWYIG